MTPPAPGWRPTASLDHLRLRAGLLARVRAFFAARGVLEVETPVLSHAAVPDVHLASLACPAPGLPGSPRLFLQTSPEYAMKRLLAAGSGPIYQLARVFRDGESGARHNPEFTLLEWYRPGFDHHRLMDEVEALLAETLASSPPPPAERLTYAELFRREVDLDPHRAPAEEIAERCRELGVELPETTPGEPPLDRDDLLQLLLAGAIEPGLGRAGRPTFVHAFPASQAALARIVPDEEGIPVAERFEVWVAGVELANGFHELTDAAEQRRRFEHDLARRRARGMPCPPLDERFLAALEAGLPPSAGVALGFDRLAMLAAGAGSLEEVLAFPFERA